MSDMFWTNVAIIVTNISILIHIIFNHGGKNETKKSQHQIDHGTD